MIAAAMWFNSGILLFADAPAGKARDDAKKIFPRRYGSTSASPRSIFVVSKAVPQNAAGFRHCETALEQIPAGDCTIDCMREAIETSLRANSDGEFDGISATELASLVALYSASEGRYALFRTTGTALREIVGYDCEGTAAYLGHYVMRERYGAARSMDVLDLSTVFDIATETLKAIRSAHSECGKSSEMVVMYADGHVSDVQRIPHDTRKERDAALNILART